MGDNTTRVAQELYAETRKDLLARQLSNSERFDGAVLTLSTASLSVSLAFIKDIVPLERAQHLTWLIVSWWFFGLAIVSTMASFLTSQRGITTQLHYAEQYYLHGNREYLTKVNYPAKVTNFLNGVSGLLFVAAAVLTILFVSQNLQGGPAMGRDKTGKLAPGVNAAMPSGQRPCYGEDLEKKGAPIPNLQPMPETQPEPDGGQADSDQGSDTDSGKKP